MKDMYLSSAERKKTLESIQGQNGAEIEEKQDLAEGLEAFSLGGHAMCDDEPYVIDDRQKAHSLKKGELDETPKTNALLYEPGHGAEGAANGSAGIQQTQQDLKLQWRKRKNDRNLGRTNSDEDKVKKIKCLEEGTVINQEATQNSRNKAKQVDGYYSNDDVTILLDALLKCKGFERIRGRDEQDILRNLQTGSNIRTMVLAPVAEDSEEAIERLSRDIDRAYGHNIEQILVPINIPNIHWYTIQLQLLQSPGGRALEATIHDSLGIRKNSVVIEKFVAQGITVTKQVEGSLPKIQEGGFGAKNVYCGGYTARLIANLAVDPRIIGEEAWGCPNNIDYILRQEDARLVSEYNFPNAGNFGRSFIALGEMIYTSQDMSMIRSFIAKEKELKLLHELKEMYEVIPIEIKTRIQSLNIPEDPAGLYALVRDLYTSLPVLKLLFQVNEQGEIEKDAEGILKLDTNIEIEHVHKIMVEFKRKCLEFEGVGVAGLEDDGVEHFMPLSYDLNTGYSNAKLVDKELEHIKEMLDKVEPLLKRMQTLYKCDHTDIANFLKNSGFSYTGVADLLNNAGLAYQELGDYRRALDYLEPALNMRNSFYKCDHSTISNSLNHIGVSYGKLGDARKSFGYHEQALIMRQSLYKGDHPDVAHSLSKVGLAYQQLGDAWKGLYYLELALKMRQALYKDNHHDIAASLNNVGLAYDGLGYTREGLGYLEPALKMRQDLYKDNHPCLANSLNNVGLSYVELGDVVEGLNYLELALKMRQALYKGDHPDVAASLNAVGIAYKELGYYRKALDYLLPSLKMSQALYKGDHPDVADSLNDVGLVYQELEDYKNALDHLCSSLKMRQALYKGNHHDIANSLNNVGLAYQELRDCRKALDYLELALKMKQSLYKGDHIDIATSLNNVGNAYWKLGNIRTSLEYHKKALKIRQSLYKGNHLDIVASLNNVGLAYRELGDYMMALYYLEPVLNMIQSLYKGNHPYVATSLNNLGNVYRKLGNARVSLYYHKQALDMRQSLYKGAHLDVAASLNNVGLAYRKLGDISTSIEYLKSVLKMVQSLYKGGHTAVAVSLDNVGLAYMELGDVQNGLEYHKQALEMGQSLYKGDHLTVALFLNNVGIAYQKLGMTSKGIEYLEQAKAMRHALELAKANQQVAQEQFKGQGTLNHGPNSYLEYYNSGLDQVLALRFNGLGHNSNAVMLESRYFDEELFPTEKLVHDVIITFSHDSTQAILAPINLNNKHWLGLLFTSLGNIVEVTYMDSEQGAMLPSLRLELENSLSINGYKSRFSEARLTPQSYNNCGYEVIENFVYYLTGTRATQEASVYVHSLLVENSLLNPEKYGLRLEENNKLIGFLSNAELVRIKEISLLVGQGHEVGERLVTNVELGNERLKNQGFGLFSELLLRNLGLELLFKKILYRKELGMFVGMVDKYGIELPSGLAAVDLLLDNSKFNKLVMNRIHPDKNPFSTDVAHEDIIFVMDIRNKFTVDLNLKKLLEDSITKANPALHKASIGFKVLDIVIDSSRLLYEPTMLQAKKLVLGYVYLHGMIVGVNSYSTVISGAEVLYQIQLGEYRKAADVAMSALSAMALPAILAQINMPYLGFAYGVWVAVNTAYNAINNAYSFALELRDGDAALKSAMAYKNLVESLATTPLQCLYDFRAYVKEYELQINGMLFKKAKLAIQVLLEEKGELVQKLFDNLHLPSPIEKYALNDLIKGILTIEKTETLKSKPITITSAGRSYDNCMEIKNTENAYAINTKHYYYCYNDKLLLEHLLIGDDNRLKVFEFVEMPM